MLDLGSTHRNGPRHATVVLKKANSHGLAFARVELHVIYGEKINVIYDGIQQRWRVSAGQPPSQSNQQRGALSPRKWGIKSRINPPLWRLRRHDMFTIFIGQEVPVGKIFAEGSGDGPMPHAEDFESLLG